MTATALPVGSREDQILNLLRAGRPADLVAAVGRHHGTWTPEDVQRVHQQYLQPPTRIGVRRAGRPDAWAPPRLTDEPDVIAISLREGDVLTGLCLGLSNRDMADELNISQETVKTHLKRLYTALGARDRAHAAALACSGAVELLVTVKRPETPTGPRR